MTRHVPDSNRDTTVVQFSHENPPQEPLPFTPVAVTPGRQAPRNTPYLAQQTSFDQYTPGLNPLVNAASHLLLEIIHMKGRQEVSLDALRSRLEAEVRSFYAQATAMGISEAQANVAQYLLCTALDESVVSSSILDAQSGWQHNSLLSTFHKDTWGGETFFDVLNRAMEQPASRLYLLELIYLLLSLGYEGKFRLQERGPLALEMLRDQLYRQIHLLRGEPGLDLSKKIVVKEFRHKHFTHIPLWLVAGMVVVCLTVTFGVFSFTLDTKATPLLSRFQQYAPKGNVVSAAPSAPAEREQSVPNEGAALPETSSTSGEQGAVEGNVNKNQE